MKVTSTAPEFSIKVNNDHSLAFHIQPFFSYEVNEFIVDAEPHYILHPWLALDSFGLYTGVTESKHRHLPHHKKPQEEKEPGNCLK